MPSRRPAHGTGNSASARKSQGRHNLLLDIAGNAGVVLFDINARFAVRAEHTPREDTLISGGVCYSGVYLTISRAPDLLSRVNKISPSLAMQAGAPAFGGAS